MNGSNRPDRGYSGEPHWLPEAVASVEPPLTKEEWSRLRLLFEDAQLRGLCAEGAQELVLRALEDQRKNGDIREPD